ncbi:LysM peptidoglycan-binding domain-containing protein [Alkaliphilus hydrothermalis]|uniref:LysM repeat protein n=1 Tax=Alkaliphilus hydrothermalis TaxID=1482730 RepID=A0ABS2NM90_9FIRM|nr:LysM peptidoglycan-binding domain-containing protein [Alkaliphilus hydrothermalis]MBM7614062.1 LysM repeat protein [Alkaliphilus hydrothermalis]
MYSFRPCPPGTVPYMIRPGDTFYRIAMQFNTTVAALVSANPTVNPNYLFVGQQICIPRQPMYPPCPEGNYYTIRPGDTYFSIARFFNVSVDDLAEANPGVDLNRLFPGQIICIPLATPPVTCPAGTTPYTVVRGDTFFSLAVKFNTTVDAIRRANPTINPDALLIGQVICIPGPAVPPPPPPPSTCPTGTAPYTIKSGDTFYSLAIRNNTTIEAIQAANPTVDPNNLQVGQVICIPTGTPPPPPPPPPATCPEGTTAYTIKAGDTFYSLSIRYNTTIEAIQVANPTVDPNNLRIGQVICIPRTTPPTCPTGTTPYTIKSGDTFYNLSIRYNTSVEAIRRANPGVDPDALRVGQIICMPGSLTPSCPVGSAAYTIEAGDTFFSLARRYNTTVDAIQALNPDVDPNNLRIGQVICIPAERGEE